MSSSLECLPSVLFDHICKFLSFDQKCNDITRLSHRCHQTFDIVRCCKNDTIRITNEFAFESLKRPSINESINHSLLNASKRLFLVPNVQAIVCSNSPLIHNDPSVFASLRAAVRGKLLRSMSLYEPDWQNLSPQCTTLIEQLVLLDLPQSLTLSSLHLSCHPKSLEIDGWSVLSQCRSLTSLTLDLPCGHGFFSRDTDTSASMMFDSLPTSITHLKVTRVTLQGIAWSKAFASPTFLPWLRRFEASDTEYIDHDTIEAITTTLIPQLPFPRIRPIRCLPMQTHDSRHYMSFTNLHTIRVKIDSSFIHELINLPYATFRHLRSFYFHIVASKSEPASVSPLLEFLCQPDIEEIGIFVPRYGGKPFNDASVMALSNLRSLKKLDLEISGQERLFDAIDIENLVPRNSWPKLSMLRLAYTRCSIIHITEMFLAAPNLVDCMLTAVFGTGIDSATIISTLFMCGIFCPYVKRLHISMYDQTHSCGLREVVRASLLYPPPPTVFRNLTSLEMHGMKMDDAALHLLMVKLNSPPRLRWFFGDVIPKTSLSTYLLMHRLPYFEPRCEKWFTSVVKQCDLSHIDCMDMVECVPCRGRSQSDVDEVDGYFCNSCSLTGHVRPVKSHIVFRRDGRHAFLDAVRARLGADEKQRLALWDASEYDKNSDLLGLSKPALVSSCAIM